MYQQLFTQLFQSVLVHRRIEPATFQHSNRKSPEGRLVDVGLHAVVRHVPNGVSRVAGAPVKANRDLFKPELLDLLLEFWKTEIKKDTH